MRLGLGHKSGDTERARSLPFDRCRSLYLAANEPQCSQAGRDFAGHVQARFSAGRPHGDGSELARAKGKKRRALIQPTETNSLQNGNKTSRTRVALAAATKERECKTWSANGCTTCRSRSKTPDCNSYSSTMHRAVTSAVLRGTSCGEEICSATQWPGQLSLAAPQPSSPIRTKAVTGQWAEGERWSRMA